MKARRPSFIAASYAARVQPGRVSSRDARVGANDDEDVDDDDGDRGDWDSSDADELLGAAASNDEDGDDADGVALLAESRG